MSITQKKQGRSGWLSASACSEPRSDHTDNWPALTHVEPGTTEDEVIDAGRPRLVPDDAPHCLLQTRLQPTSRSLTPEGP